MTKELPEIDFQRFWRRLQQIGLNAYEARSYLVLVGHPRFKALELAARSHVPRQKIYEVLDSLIEKGFAQVVQEKTKLFSAVEPSLAIPSYLAREDPDQRVIPPAELIKHLDDPSIAEPMERDARLKKAIRGHLDAGDMVVCMAGGGGGSLDDWLRENFAQ